MRFFRACLLLVALVTILGASVSPQTSSTGDPSSGEQCGCEQLAGILHRIGEAETARAAYDRLSKEDWAQQTNTQALQQRLDSEVQVDLNRYEKTHPFTHAPNPGGRIAETGPTATGPCEVTYFVKVNACFRTFIDLHENVHLAACSKWWADHPWDFFHTWNTAQTTAQSAQEDVAAYSAELPFLRAMKAKLEKKCLGTLRVKTSAQLILTDGAFHAHWDSSPDVVIKLSFADDDTFQGEGPVHLQIHGTTTDCVITGSGTATLRSHGDVDQRMHVSIDAVDGFHNTATATCQDSKGRRYSHTQTLRGVAGPRATNADLNPEPAATATVSLPPLTEGWTGTMTITIASPSDIEFN